MYHCLFKAEELIEMHQFHLYKNKEFVEVLALIARNILNFNCVLNKEDIMISQAIRVLNLSWYGVSYMHIVFFFYLMVKLHDFSL